MIGSKSAKKVRPTTALILKTSATTPYLRRINKGNFDLKFLESESSKIENQMFQAIENNVYDNPLKGVQSATSIRMKTITKRNRLASIHPMYRKQWRRYRKKRLKVLNEDESLQIANTQKGLKISFAKRK